MSNPRKFSWAIAAFSAGIALATAAAHADVTSIAIPPSPIADSGTGTGTVASVWLEILMRLNVIEKRLDKIGEFQKTVVAPMHQQMLDGINRLEGHK